MLCRSLVIGLIVISLWIGGAELGPSHSCYFLEPGSGDAFEIDEGLGDFITVDLVEAPSTYPESELFELWRSSGGDVPGADQCVGFKVTLFLGGAGAIDNLVPRV